MKKEEEKVRGFETPVEYIQYQDRTELDYDDVVEYDMDSDDEHWLPKAKKMNWGKKYNFTMTPEIFEIIIDYLEKESFKQKEFSQLMVENEGKYPTVSNMDDDDLPCCVCNEGDSDASNLIVFCDGCDIAVHQECQGIKVVPSGTWLCDRCAFDDTLKNKKKNHLIHLLLEPVKKPNETQNPPKKNHRIQITLQKKKNNKNSNAYKTYTVPSVIKMVVP